MVYCLVCALQFCFELEYFIFYRLYVNYNFVVESGNILVVSYNLDDFFCAISQRKGRKAERKVASIRFKSLKIKLPLLSIKYLSGRFGES